MNHLTNQNARGSAMTTLIGGVVILLAVLFFLVKLAGSGYHSNVDETTPSATEPALCRKVTLLWVMARPLDNAQANKFLRKYVYNVMRRIA